MLKILKKLPGMSQIYKKFKDLQTRVEELEKTNSEITDKIRALEEKDRGLDYRIDDLYHENYLTRKEILQYYGRYIKNEGMEELVSDWFFKETGERLDLANPTTYNQKIQWIKLYGVNAQTTMLSDKYKVREWISKTIGEQYLIPLLGVWNSFEEIDFDSLPDRFVLKANHGSGMNAIIEDKKSLDMGNLKNKVHEWLRTDYAFYSGFEMQYSNIERKIIAEKYMENSAGNLNDYKVLCFNGEPKYILYVTNRRNSVKKAFYDLEWNKQPFVSTQSLLEEDVEKPKQLDKMIELSRVLSKGFCHVRVDWYLFDDGTIKFGEMIFTPLSGIGKWCPPEYNKILGDLIQLPEKID